MDQIIRTMDHIITSWITLLYFENKLILIIDAYFNVCFHHKAKVIRKQPKNTPRLLYVSYCSWNKI